MKRSCESLIRSYLETFPCVAIIGVRQCGKTTLLKTLPGDWKHYDLERRADHEVVSRDPDAFFRLHPRRVALDEVQLAPDVFPALRVAIDEHRAEKGRFVITGSSSPDLPRSVSESLAGRVAIIELAPFSWEEVTQTWGRDSLLRRLLNRKAKPVDLIEGLEARGQEAQAHEFWFRGGFPEPWLTPGDEFRRRWVEQYLQTYLYRDVKRLWSLALFLWLGCPGVSGALFNCRHRGRPRAGRGSISVTSRPGQGVSRSRRNRRCPELCPIARPA